MGTALCAKPSIITQTARNHLHTTMSTFAHHLTRRLTRVAEWLFTSVLFFLPWQTRYIIHQGTLGGEPWEYGTLSLYGVDLLIAALIIVALVARITTPKDAPRNRASFTTTHWMALLLLSV